MSSVKTGKPKRDKNGRFVSSKAASGGKPVTAHPAEMLTLGVSVINLDEKSIGLEKIDAEGTPNSGKVLSCYNGKLCWVDPPAYAGGGGPRAATQYEVDGGVGADCYVTPVALKAYIDRRLPKSMADIGGTAPTSKSDYDEGYEMGKSQGWFWGALTTLALFAVLYGISSNWDAIVSWLGA